MVIPCLSDWGSIQGLLQFKHICLLDRIHHVKGAGAHCMGRLAPIKIRMGWLKSYVEANLHGVLQVWLLMPPMMGPPQGMLEVYSTWESHVDKVECLYVSILRSTWLIFMLSSALVQMLRPSRSAGITLIRWESLLARMKLPSNMAAQGIKPRPRENLRSLHYFGLNELPEFPKLDVLP